VGEWMGVCVGNPTYIGWKSYMKYIGWKPYTLVGNPLHELETLCMGWKPHTHIIWVGNPIHMGSRNSTHWLEILCEIHYWLEALYEIHWLETLYILVGNLDTLYMGWKPYI
jgi:hypothetical protein